MAKESAAPRVASTNPDDMIQAGLRDDFFGEIVKSEACVFDYAGNAEKYGCSAAIHWEVKIDDEEETYDVYLTCGDLRNWVPSEDAKKPAGGLSVEDYASIQGYRETRNGPLIVKSIPTAEELAVMRGPYLLGVGKQDGLPNNSNYAFALQTLKGAGYDNWSAGIPGFEGLYGHFARLTPPSAKKHKGSGIVDTGDGESSGGRKDALVMDEIVEVRGKGKKGAAKAKPRTKVESEPEEEAEVQEEAGAGGDDDFEAEVMTAVVDAVMEAGGSMTKQKAVTAAFAAFAKDKTKKMAAMKLAGDPGFYERSEMLTYDEESNEVSMAE